MLICPGKATASITIRKPVHILTIPMVAVALHQISTYPLHIRLQTWTLMFP